MLAASIAAALANALTSLCCCPGSDHGSVLGGQIARCMMVDLVHTMTKAR
jgi:hypothetical protein